MQIIEARPYRVTIQENVARIEYRGEDITSQVHQWKLLRAGEIYSLQVNERIVPVQSIRGNPWQPPLAATDRV